MSSQSGTIPHLYLMPKLHKKNNEDGTPQTRAVVGAANGMTTRGGELVCGVLSALVRCHPEQEECPSTEACLCVMEDSEEVVKRTGVNVIVGSMDAVGLYPNLDVLMAAREVAKEIMESQINMANIDFRQAAIYLATVCTPDELKEADLTHLVPVRLHKNGPKPTVRTKEIVTRVRRGGKEEMMKKDEPNETERWRMIVMCMRMKRGWATR